MYLLRTSFNVGSVHICGFSEYLLQQDGGCGTESK